MTEPAPHPDFEAESQRVRGVLQAEGRSDSLLRLFDYLHLHSHDLRTPKEIEIAFEVFGKDPRFDTSQDAMVRVWIHRLRTRLDEIYRDAPGPRLAVPKGQYRLAMIEPEALPAQPEDTTVIRPERSPVRGLRFPRVQARWIAILAVVSILGWAALFYVRSMSTAADARAGSLFATAGGRCGVPLVAAGDSYLYLRTGSAGQAPRLVMRPGITSSAQLEAVRAGALADGGQLIDRDTYYMAASSADGLWSLLGAASVTAGKGARPPSILPNSKLTQQALNQGNILYFGRLDQLGLLHDIVFEASRFSFDPLSDTLRDGASQRQFAAQLTDAINRQDRDPLRRPAFTSDYGYIARIMKPDGCAVVIVAGLQDAALPQIARIASDQARLDDLSRQSHGARSFEALFEIRSLGALRHESRLVVVRALHPAR